MQPIFSLSALLACAGAALAAPSSLPSASQNLSIFNKRSDTCLDDADGARLAAQFADLVGNYTAAKADALLLPDYADYSDGINSLMGRPPGSETFAGREAFKAAQAGHGGTPMVVSDVVAVTCDAVVWTWTAAFGEAAKSVRGINVVRYVLGEDGNWWVARVDMEMNSLVYLEDLGGSWTMPATA
ncbi:hypothetical protein PFICI_06307 [Pestalotiopsis fici W106-1]|uniref:NTF2-like domain-containing protein n=1 Tax=Pestalotiopsis fici (strain W106-1 / CGMCC3.15140) TaxID=1229662 RepID=W3X5I1_PESFW|nr:uncharacterized protein PFICI_06307 [Pestalotiopsis fici W106-1]ETS81305.1 hypothetical protein PFICI_06307 [Pestalotiopsis fici W106-1]